MREAHRSCSSPNITCSSGLCGLRHRLVAKLESRCPRKVTARTEQCGRPKAKPGRLPLKPRRGVGLAPMRLHGMELERLSNGLAWRDGVRVFLFFGAGKCVGVLCCL